MEKESIAAIENTKQATAAAQPAVASQTAEEAKPSDVLRIGNTAGVLQNDELHVELRRNQDVLSVVGLGIIMFGIWSVIKTVLFISLDPNGLAAEELHGRGESIAFWVLVCIVLSIDLWFRMRVGRAARAEAQGKKKGRGYLVLAFLMALGSMGVIVGEVYSIVAAGFEWRFLVGIIVEITSCTLLLEMIVAAGRVRRLTREISKQEG